jgi:hypothetical protein
MRSNILHHCVVQPRARHFRVHNRPVQRPIPVHLQGLTAVHSRSQAAGDESICFITSVYRHHLYIDLTSNQLCS